MKRYDDCQRTDGMCGACSICSYGRDCHNNEINGLLYQRTSKMISQAELAKESGVNIRQIQRYESEDSDVGNMTLKNAIAIAKALDCRPEELI